MSEERPILEAVLFDAGGNMSPVSHPTAQAWDLIKKNINGQIDRDTFSHTGANGSNPADRMKAAGYVFTAPSQLLLAVPMWFQERYEHTCVVPLVPG